MSVEPFITVTLEERPHYDIFYIVVNHPLPTPLQWVFTMEEVKEGLERCKVKGKRFAFIMDVRQLGMLSLKHTKEFVHLMESYGDMFVDLLIGSSGKIDLSGWTREAQLEATHYAQARGLSRESVLPAVIIKARGKSISDAYLVFKLGDIFGE